MFAPIIYPAGTEPVSGWQTFLSVSTASLIEVFASKKDRLPSLAFKREAGTHKWWCHAGKGKHQMTVGLFDVVQVSIVLSSQPAGSYIHVSEAL